jgi:MFS family permease
MFIFAAATAWCALAQSMTSFIAARAVCGLGAGCMMTLGAITISDCVPIEYVCCSFLRSSFFSSPYLYPHPCLPGAHRPCLISGSAL